MDLLQDTLKVLGVTFSFMLAIWLVVTILVLVLHVGLGLSMWVVDLVIDGIAVVVFTVMAFLALRRGNWITGLLLAGYAGKLAWGMWNNWKNNHKKRRASLLGKIVINLGHRLAIGDAP